ncbi:reverse transcriptase domain-containing protein [Cellvibrio sp. NN19]|uniref:reverse transcriptase domain-containing protein n=1 Tax=Cellvibrio chitinivorans TaxID=3102792 RepID=UPI002B401549|nr:reverse transcriptase domain-containing protein [Cellvibrio sp. NN19]
MTVEKLFKKSFSKERLEKIFTDYVIYSGATGIDNLDQYAFRKQLNEQIDILSRKVESSTYKFSKYKLKLVSKGRNKIPREISIPTVRDRIALRALCDFLGAHYKNTINFDLPQNIVKKVKSDVSSGRYDGYIKLDITNFYPSVRHDELLSRLRKKIRDQNILDFIFSALTSPTVTVSKPSDSRVNKGVPQGLAISNILAAIYLINIDRYLSSLPKVSCYRYVDDVLIFCSRTDAESIAREIIKRFSKIGLQVHDPIKAPEKSSIGSIIDSFDYLGYQFSNSLISARQGSVEKLKSSLVAIFTTHAHSKGKNENFLLWRLNLRITGCVFENKSKGWLFFFAEINDEKLLHTLDNHVKKLCRRFNVDVTPKKFVRAFKELTHKRYETNYIPNFDKYDIDMMRAVLVDYFGMNVSKLEDEEVKFEFHKRVGRQVKDLLSDVKDFGY